MEKPHHPDLPDSSETVFAVKERIPDLFNESNPTCVVWTPESTSNQVVIGTAGREIILVDLDDGFVRNKTIQTPSPVLSVACTNNRIIGGCMGGEIVLVNRDGESEMIILKPHGSSHILGIKISPDGNRFSTFGRDSTIAIFDSRTLSELSRFRFPTKVACMAWISDDEIAVTMFESPKIQFFDAITKRSTGSTHMNASVKDHSAVGSPVAITVWGKFIAVSLSSFTTHLFEVKRDCPVRSFYTTAENDNPCIAFTDDGSFILISGSERIEVFETNSQHRVYDIPAHSKRVRSFAKHPKKNVFASISFDKQLVLF